MWFRIIKERLVGYLIFTLFNKEKTSIFKEKGEENLNLQFKQTSQTIMKKLFGVQKFIQVILTQEQNWTNDNKILQF